MDDESDYVYGESNPQAAAGYAITRSAHFTEVANSSDPCPHCCGFYGEPGVIVEVSKEHSPDNILNCEHCGDRVQR